jgi:hypothetical protein
MAPNTIPLTSILFVLNMAYIDNILLHISLNKTGWPKRKIYLMNAIWCMLYNSQLPKTYWGEAILTANYLQNQLPTSALSNDNTPFEKWYSFKPNVFHLRVFGCRTFAYIEKDIRTKLDSTIVRMSFPWI